MIIYSPLPPELIWQEAGDTNYRIVEDSVDGVRMQIMLLGDNRARVERILSTDPRDFLHASNQPGTIIEYTLTNRG